MISAPSASASVVGASGPLRLIQTQPPHSSAATSGERTPARWTGSKSSRSGTPTSLPVVSYTHPWYGQVNRRAPHPLHSVTMAGPRWRHTLWKPFTLPSAWRTITAVSPWPS